MPFVMRTPLLAAAALLLASTSTASLADTLVRNANGSHNPHEAMVTDDLLATTGVLALFLAERAA